MLPATIPQVRRHAAVTIRLDSVVFLAAVFGLAPLLAAAGADPPKAEGAPAWADGFALPDGAVRRFGNRQLRHPEGILASAVSPDGKYLATASYSAVVVWDLKTLAARRVLSGIHFNNYGSGDRGGRLAFLPDSASLLVGLRPPDLAGPVRFDTPLGLARVWDVESGKAKFALDGAWDFNTSVWVTGGGSEIALLSNVGNDSQLRLFDAKDGKPLRTIRAPHLFDTPWIARDGDVIAFRGKDGNGLVVLDARTGKELHTFPAVKVVQAALSPDGNLLVYQDEKKTVRAYDLGANKELLSFTHPAERPGAPMAVSADKQTLYLGSEQGHLYRWDLAANKPIPLLGRHSLWTLTGLALSPDGSTLHTTGLDRMIRRWDLKANRQLPLPDGYQTLAVMTLGADGRRLFVGDHAAQLDEWDLATGRKVRALSPAGNGGITCLATSPDGKWLACGREVQDVQLWDVAAGKVAREVPLVATPDRLGGDPVQRVAFSPDSKVLLATTPNTGTTAWEVATGRRLWTAPDTGRLAAYDPRGRWVASGGGYTDQEVHWSLLDARTGDVVARAEVQPVAVRDGPREYRHPVYVWDAAFLPDGSALVTGHYDGTVRLWDSETRREVGRWDRGRPGSVALAVSPDGRWVGVGGEDGGFSVWEVATGKRVHAAGGHHSVVTQLAFTRDGRGLVTNADLAPVLWTLVPKDLPAVDGPADQLWEALASADGAKAYRVVWALAQSPAVAVKLFAGRVKPAELAVDRGQFDQWVADLDGPQFRAREAAEKELTKAGTRAPVDWLRKALAGAKSDEQRARLGRVLAARDKPMPDEWRLGRAVQVLERAGTDEAKALLKAWAAAPEGSLLGLDAKGALERLGQR